MSAFGATKFVWFRRLKNSDRNCSAMPSRAGMRKFLLTPRSHCQKFGVRKAFRPTLPNGALAGGIANAALLKYWSMRAAPARAGRIADEIRTLHGEAAIVGDAAGAVVRRRRRIDDVHRQCRYSPCGSCSVPIRPGLPSKIAFTFEPNLRPRPNGSWYTMLVTFISFTSKLDGPRSAPDYRCSADWRRSGPRIVSSACSELPSAFDQVNEFSRYRPAEKRCSSARREAVIVLLPAGSTHVIAPKLWIRPPRLDAERSARRVRQRLVVVGDDRQPHAVVAGVRQLDHPCSSRSRAGSTRTRSARTASACRSGCKRHWHSPG